MKEKNFFWDQREMGQLNLRVSRNTADGFRMFCKEKGLTQNEALASLLLSQSHDGNDSAEAALIDEIKRYQEELRDIKEKYEELKHRKKEKVELDWLRCRDWTKVINMIFHYVTRAFELPGQSTMKIKRAEWPDQKAAFLRHKYPEDAGCMIVELDGLLYSNGLHPAVFVLAHRNVGETTELVKFRWYPSGRFVGVSPVSTGYACPGSLWMMGYMQASDGAATLISSIPLDSLRPSEQLAEAIEKATKNDSLVSRIADAEKRKTRNT